MNDTTLRSIRELSEAETPLAQNVRTQGPGGQAYDLAPSPPAAKPASQDASWAKRGWKAAGKAYEKYKTWNRSAPVLGTTFCFALGVAAGYAWARRGEG